ncbi:MAG TPA: hypothetical protein VFN53_06015 [Acidobacteriaceae bacterium]|nr:hypothetical protein [Acidobacteriaceae bacterium]
MSTWLHFALPAVCEMAFLIGAIFAIHRAQKNRIFPAFWSFLLFWVASDGVMLGEGYLRHLHLINKFQFYSAYFYTYWPCFAISAILILRVLHEMFRHAVRSVPGVQMLGRPIFFWAVVVSVILAFASGVTPHTEGMSLLFASAQVLARSESVLALCMIAFLAFASRTLGVSYASRIFGVAFGLGVMATANLVNSAMLTHIGNLVSLGNTLLPAANLVAIAVWCVYFVKPEPVRRLVTMPTQSPLMRWNDIAQQLGNPAGQIPVSYPPSFMSGIQAFVDSVMTPMPTPQSGNLRSSGLSPVDARAIQT